MSFEPILTLPEIGDPYFNGKLSGGYSTCIQGKPTVKGLDRLSNCVALALGIFHKQANCPQFNLLDPINAGGLVENARQKGLRTGDTPELGALIVWKIKGTKDKGHVASVQAVGMGGEITTANSGYNSTKAFWVKDYKPPYRYHKEEYELQGFIYLPKSPYVPPNSIRKGDKGADVIWMQNHLHRHGYLRKSEIDGSFGKITLGALCGFQLEHGLVVDGVCGAATKAELVK